MRTLTEQEAQAKRLREARESLFPKAVDGWRHAKRYVKVSQATYNQHENGTRGFKAHAEGYALAFKTTAAWLVWGDENSVKPIEIPVTGKVAAGITGDFESYSESEDRPMVMFDPGEISAVLDIEGMSMMPRYRHGEKVLCGFKYDDPTPFIRKEVFVQTRDGHKLFKVLQRGSRAGLWDLYSLNQDFDPIRNVEIDWVAPVKWHMV